MKPTVFYLPDKDGRLQAVFDFSYEDFIELYKLKKQLAQRDERPRFTLEKLMVSGRADGNRAELIVRLHVALHDADWVRIPLRLDQAILLEPATHKGQGELIMQYLGAGEGYVAWLRGPADAGQEIEMRLAVPVAASGADHKLKLYLPRAAISEWKSNVAESSITAQVSEGATLSSPAATAEGGSEINVRGPSGDFELSWRKATDANAFPPGVLEAVGSILARLDDRGISSEAALTLRSYGLPFDRFTVRLPDGAELTPSNNAGYSLVPLENREDEADGRRRLVEVRLPKKVVGPVEVRIACRRQLDPKDSAAWCDLAGFEVLDAARQWGSFAAATTGDWQVLWGASRGVRQVDQLPESLRVSGVAGGFEYFAEPFELQARLNPRRTRINVEPEYVLFVDRDRVRLDAKLTYTVHGAKARVLRILLPDWQLERVEPESLVVAEGIDTDENGVLSIPLIEPASGNIELHLTARQTFSSGATSIAIGLPQPQDAASVSAVVAVSPADNVELTPNDNVNLGLIRQQTALPLKLLPERRQEPLFYRSEGKAAVFAADVRVHARRIAVEMSDRVQLADRAAQVEQKMAYMIQFVAVDHLLLDVPQSVAGSGSLEFQRDGKPLPFKAMAPSEDDSVPAGMARMRVSLPEACLGRCEITSRYVVPLAALQAVKPTVESVPLIVPADAELSGNRLLLAAAPGVKAGPRDSSWQPEKDSSRPGPPAPRSYATVGPVDHVTLDIGKEESSGINTTVIERAWIQTWLTTAARQDRAVFQLLTNQSELSLKMPPGAVLSQMAVLLDDKRIDFRVDGSGRLPIALPRDGELHRHVLEIIYHFDEISPTGWRLTFAFPQVGSGAWNRRLYWQLILPQNEHVLADPRGFVSEYRWGFMGYFWGRQPVLSQAELETWVGAEHRAAPSDGLNVYLFSTLGTIEGGEVRTASRALIVLLSSGTVLLIGLLLVYVPSLRHPVALMALAFGLLSLGMIYPEPTILLAQTSSIGLVLAMIAALFVRMFPYRRKPVSHSAIIKPDIPSTRSPQPVPASAASVSSTQNLPMPSE